MAEKRNIFLVGPMGAGKSTIGRQLAQQLNMEFYDSDQEIEKRTGADVGWVFDVEGEEGFRDREEKVINELTEKQGIVLATGGGSVKSRETRNRLSARGVVVYLETRNNWRVRSVIKNARCCRLRRLHAKFWKPLLVNAIRCTKRLLTSPFAPTTRALKWSQTRLFICWKATDSGFIYTRLRVKAFKVDVALWRGLQSLSVNGVTLSLSRLVCLTTQLPSYH